jgi:hemerythrin-like domain-containing protein
MLVQLGPRNTGGDVVDLLIECHGRIRKFLVLARRLARAAGSPRAEIRDTARQIRRYFVESFPLHRADEDDELAPRLAGLGVDVDRALATMTADHLEHEPSIARLIGLCTAIGDDPAQLAALADDLAQVAAELATGLESHLELEERAIFPHVRRLPTGEQSAIQAALRDRRESAPDAAR